MADCDYNPHVYTSKKLIFLSVATHVGVIRRVRLGCAGMFAHIGK